MEILQKLALGIIISSSALCTTMSAVNRDPKDTIQAIIESKQKNQDFISPTTRLLNKEDYHSLERLLVLLNNNPNIGTKKEITLFRDYLKTLEACELKEILEKVDQQNYLRRYLVDALKQLEAAL